MTYAIKTEVRDLTGKTFEFRAQKTMYGGKDIAEGDPIFIFASENEGGPGADRPWGSSPRPWRSSASPGSSARHRA